MKQKKLSKTEINECLRFRFWKLYIRLRDTDKNWRWSCISSWTKLYRTEWQAGHFIPNGSCKKHTRDENNVNLQSYWDNVCKHWNILRYEDSLRIKIWNEYVDYLKSTKNEIRWWKEWELIELIQKFREKTLQRMIIKSKKIQNEILQYIQKYAKKKRQTLYEV